MPRFPRSALELTARAGPLAAFAMVMATGIVSAALGEAGLAVAADALLVIAGAGFLLILAAVGARAVMYPALLAGAAAVPWLVLAIAVPVRLAASWRRPDGRNASCPRDSHSCLVQ